MGGGRPRSHRRRVHPGRGDWLAALRQAPLVVSRRSTVVELKGCLNLTAGVEAEGGTTMALGLMRRIPGGRRPKAPKGRGLALEAAWCAAPAVEGVGQSSGGPAAFDGARPAVPGEAKTRPPWTPTPDLLQCRPRLGGIKVARDGWSGGQPPRACVRRRGEGATPRPRPARTATAPVSISCRRGRIYPGKDPEGSARLWSGSSV